MTITYQFGAVTGHALVRVRAAGPESYVQSGGGDALAARDFWDAAGPIGRPGVRRPTEPKFPCHLEYPAAI